MVVKKNPDRKEKQGNRQAIIFKDGQIPKCYSIIYTFSQYCPFLYPFSGEYVKIFSKGTFQKTNFDFTEDSSNAKTLENHPSSLQIQALNMAKKEYRYNLENKTY